MKKKRVLLGLGVIVLIVVLCSVSLYDNHVKKIKKEAKENKIRTGSSHTSMTIEDIIAMNSGEGEYQKDSFLVLRPDNLSRWSISNISVIPEQSVVFQEFDYTYKWTYKEPFIKNKNFRKANVLFYNLRDRTLMKTIDNTPWMDEYPDYQLNSAYYKILAGKGDEYFLKIEFRSRPQLPYDYERKQKIKWFSVYHNLVTGEAIMLKEDQKGKEKAFLADEPTKEFLDNYARLVEDSDFWDDYCQQEGLSNDDNSVFDETYKFKKDKPAYFDVSVGVDLGVMVEINLSTNALPKENAGLYARFPELKQYVEQEWRVVKIFLSGHPSKEEIAALFADESKDKAE